MTISENNTNGSRSLAPHLYESSEPGVSQMPPPANGSTNPEVNDEPAAVPAAGFATRAGINAAGGIDKTKLILLGGGLAAAVLFFVFTAVIGKSPMKQTAGKQTAPQANHVELKEQKGSVTPLMETVRTSTPDNASGQLAPADIRRTRSTDGDTASRASSVPALRQIAAKPGAVGSLGNVPSFADTQQKWEEPQPYGEPTPTPASQSQQQNTLKEPSLIFVPSQIQSRTDATNNVNSGGDNAPLLDITPGTRIQAKLETQISSAVQAPVVAVVEYTYAIGDKIVVPAGARVYGQLQQADRSGLVSVKFDEIQLLDGAREKIDAIGTGLDLGPIKGNVFGKNTGKSFLVRAASGVGSVLAEIAGNNSSAAFSEDDMLRERVAENIGTAGDSEVMNLNANSRVVVSVPADTKIYIVFTKQQQNSAQLHKIASVTQ